MYGYGAKTALEPLYVATARRGYLKGMVKDRDGVDVIVKAIDVKAEELELFGPGGKNSENYSIAEGWDMSEGERVGLLIPGIKVNMVYSMQCIYISLKQPTDINSVAT